MGLELDVLALRLAICRLGPGGPAPTRPAGACFWSVTQTPEETSLVIPEEYVDPGWQAERGWRVLRVRGPLPFELVGVLNALSGPLAREGIGVFVLSTYDTDYMLVRATDLKRAVEALVSAGHRVAPPSEAIVP